MKKDITVLAIESSCDETSAAVVKNGRQVLSDVIYSQIDLHTLYGGVVPEIASRKHIEKINQVIEKALADAGEELCAQGALRTNGTDFKDIPFGLDDIDAVCVSSGPGSYTGLRIGVSSAKGICYALDIPLISVPTLQNMASLYYMQHPDYQGLVCPMIDARRMECYTAIYSRDGQERGTMAEVIEKGMYDMWLDRGPVTFIGDGAAKTHDILSVHQNACYDTDFTISASGMIPIAEAKMANNETENVAYFEPFYLKDFVAKKSVVHGLRD